VKKPRLTDLLCSLREENPTKIVSVVRMLWPDIKAALDRGHSVKAIHEQFVKSGLTVSYRLLALYVGQLRREHPTSGITLLTHNDNQTHDHVERSPALPTNQETAILVRIPKRRMFSARGAAQYLGIHESTLRRITEGGDLRAKRLGHRWLYSLEDLNSYIESLPDVFQRIS
jgi:excisionase family DNA binding protein